MPTDVYAVWNLQFLQLPNPPHLNPGDTEPTIQADDNNILRDRMFKVQGIMSPSVDLAGTVKIYDGATEVLSKPIQMQVTAPPYNFKALFLMADMGGLDPDKTYQVKASAHGGDAAARKGMHTKVATIESPPMPIMLTEAQGLPTASSRPTANEVISSGDGRKSGFRKRPNGARKKPVADAKATTGPKKKNK